MVSLLTVLFGRFDGALIHSAALDIAMHGPSELDAVDWRHLCTVRQEILTAIKLDEFDELFVSSIFNSSNFY